MEPNEVILARIDERTKNTDAAIADIRGDIKSIQAELSSNFVTRTSFDAVEQDYVSKKEFEPVRRIVFGVVAAVLLAVVTALVTLVLRKN